MDPILVTSVVKDTTNAPVLIIDQEGTIGIALSERIQNELATVIVSSKEPNARSTIHIPYKHRFPEIPNGLYACILFVSNNEKDLSDIVKKCCIKAKAESVPFVFICPHQFVNEHLIARILDFYDQSTVVILGELFGQGNSQLDQYIIQAGTTRSLSLPHMGLRKVHPVLFTDAIQGILQSVFGIQRHNRITYLYQQQEMTDLSIAHLLKKKDPLLHIDFLQENKRKPLEEKKITLHGFYFFDETYSVQEKLLDAYLGASVLRKDQVDEYVHKEEFTPLLNLEEGSAFSLLPEHAPQWVKKGIIYLILLLLTPYCCLLLLASLSAGAIALAQHAISHGDIMQGKIALLVARGSFSASYIVSLPVSFELQTMGLQNAAYQLNKKIAIGEDATKSAYDVLDAFEIVGKITTGASNTPQRDALAAVSLTSSSFVTLQNLLAANPDEHMLQKAFEEYRDVLNVGAGTITLLPDILAVNGKHTYLVLIQDNTELRPGGGFIGSYGIVTIDHGRIGQLTFHDVHDADDKLRQHVDPQFALRRYMGKVHLYLQDSNFDVDFVANAKKASEIFQLETGQKIDGVIGVDVSFIQSLLHVTGPIAIAGQQSPVSADNFLALLVQHAQPSESSHQQTFLLTVLKTLQTKLSTKQFTLSSLLQGLLDAWKEKHLMVALANIPDQNVLTVNHVSSSLWDPRQEATGTINDYLGISEANIGNNKGNYFMKRSITHTVSIDGEGNMTGTLQLTYTNTSKPGQWPGGDYKNYLRIILPQDTTLQGVSFDGQQQATQSAVTDPILYESSGFQAPAALEIEQTREEGKTIFGFPVTISAATTKTVSVTYSHDLKINLANPVLHYRLSLYKQPGAHNDAYLFNLNFPLAFSILSAHPANQNANSDYSLETTLSSDESISVDLTKK